MKKILLYGLSLTFSVGSVVLTSSCIDETEPTSYVSEEQVKSSEKSMESMLYGMPGRLNMCGEVFGSSYHYDWGYGSIMHIRDRFTGDLTRLYAGGYDWYAGWAYNTYQGKSYIYSQLIWNTYWKLVQSTNEMIKILPEDLDNAVDAVKGYAGAAYAYRAMLYLDLARMYEYLPCDATDPTADGGNDVTNLTVPIVDENTTEEGAKNNPRASREEMAKFILADLDKAEQYCPYLTLTSHLFPHIGCAYGLKARYYMWLEEYDKAAEYAKLAIDNTNAGVMDETACTSKTAGFNDLSKWMWGNQLVKENDAVSSGIINWVSWMCNETTFGYAGAGTYLQMDASMYERIGDNDFRKKMWAPDTWENDKSWYDSYCIDPPKKDNGEWKQSSVTYMNWTSHESIKFRPASGSVDDYNVGSATAYPLMRVEEMYFIYAEALAHTNAEQGKAALEDFMKAYRDKTYTCSATDHDAIIEEIVFQKRVELWGEGQTFFDIKRLDYSVTRGYSGTNFPESARFNTDGRPAWMNLCIVQTEENNNEALVGWNNPDPTGVYKMWTGQ